MANVKNFKLDHNSVEIISPTASASTIECINICNTTGSSITLSIYKNSNPFIDSYYIINAITLPANSTFVYLILRIQPYWTLYVESLDGKADINISYQ